jgi:hypothetical protein
MGIQIIPERTMELKIKMTSEVREDVKCGRESKIWRTDSSGNFQAADELLSWATSLHETPGSRKTVIFYLQFSMKFCIKIS